MDKGKSEVKKLLRFLSMRSEKVIQGSYKLTLTTAAIGYLNRLFCELDLEQVEGSASTSGRQQLLDTTQYTIEDVRFAYKVLKMAPQLKVIHSVDTLQGGIDLTCFSGLLSFELNKTPIHLVTGLKELSSQLMLFTCQRSLSNLVELINITGNESSTWPALLELNISHNYLKEWNETLNGFSNLVHLDVSYNELTSISAVQELKFLEHLNLSYNKLMRIPSLKCCSLKHFYIRNNVLQNLQGLEALPKLLQLDARNNFISSHSSLESLKELHFLSILRLEGNPFCFHENNRLMVSQQLSTLALKQGIALDNMMLHCEEFKDLEECESKGSFVSDTSTSEQEIATHATVDSCEQSVSKPAETDYCDSNKDIKTPSERSNIIKVENCHLAEGPELEKNLKDQKSPKSKKQHKSKEASIYENGKLGASEVENPDMFPCPETCADASHIKSKEMLKSRRKEFYEGWLVPTDNFSSLVVHNSDSVQEKKYLSKVIAPASSCLENLESSKALPQNVQLSPSLVEAIEKLSFCYEEILKTKKSSKADYDFAAFPELKKKFREAAELKRSEGFTDIKQEFKIKDGKHMVRKSDESDEDSFASVGSISGDEDGEDDIEANIYFAAIKTKGTCSSLVLKVCGFMLEEISAISGKKLDLLDLRCLVSAVLETHKKEVSDEYYVALDFDAVNPCHRKRKYILYEMEPAMNLVKTLRPFATARVLENSVKEALKCLKCKSQFSKEGVQFKAVEAKQSFEEVASTTYQITPTCPNCGSTMIIKSEPSASQLSQGRLSEQKKENITDKKKEFIVSEPSSNLRNGTFIDEFWKEADDESSTGARRKTSFSKEKCKSVKSGGSPDESSIDLQKFLLGEKHTLLSVSEQASVSKHEDREEKCKTVASSPQENFSESGLALDGESSSSTESQVVESISHLEHEEDDLKHFKLFPNALLQAQPDIIKMLASPDHKVKLYLEEYVFQRDEKLEAALKCIIVPLTTCQKIYGIVIISSDRIFLTTVFNEDSDEFQSLEVVHAALLTDIGMVESFLGKQGFSLTTKADKKSFLCLIKNVPLCLAFVSLLKKSIGNKLHKAAEMPKFTGESSADLNQVYAEVLGAVSSSDEKVFANDDKEPEILCHMFLVGKIEGNSEFAEMLIVVTFEDLYLSEVVFKKNEGENNSFLHYRLMKRQKLTDLTKVVCKKNLTQLELCFEDDHGNPLPNWFLFPCDRLAAKFLINTVNYPWKILFQTDLPIIHSDQDLEDDT